MNRRDLQYIRRVLSEADDALPWSQQNDKVAERIRKAIEKIDGELKRGTPAAAGKRQPPKE